jgi:hypothetical protein
MRTLIMAAALALLGPAALAQESQTPAREPQASIPFADLGGIRNFRPGPDRHTLLLESQRRKWYLATFFGSCSEVQYAETIGVITNHAGSVDRFSGIIVDGRRCPFRSLVEVPDPDARPVPGQSEE